MRPGGHNIDPMPDDLAVLTFCETGSQIKLTLLINRKFKEFGE